MEHQYRFEIGNLITVDGLDSHTIVDRKVTEHTLFNGDTILVETYRLNNDRWIDHYWIFKI